MIMIRKLTSSHGDQKPGSPLHRGSHGLLPFLFFTGGISPVSPHPASDGEVPPPPSQGGERRETNGVRHTVGLVNRMFQYANVKSWISIPSGKDRLLAGVFRSAEEVDKVS
jgi:hypothetical protein